MPFIDILLALYLGLGFRKGTRRGPAHEAWKALNTLTATALGAGVFSLVSGPLSEAASVGGFGGPTAFLAGFGGTFVMLRALRRRLQRALQHKLGETHRMLGGFLGLARAGGWSVAGLTTGVLSPFQELFLNHSGVASLIAGILGVESGS